MDDQERLAALERKRQKVREEAALLRQVDIVAAAAKAKEEAAQAKKEENDDASHEKPPMKVNIDAMVSRLSKVTKTPPLSVENHSIAAALDLKDFASWKRKHGLDPATKVFCLTGWYPVIKDTLEKKRGWYFNPDRNSPYFDLKWALKSDDLKHVKLHEDQLVNHFCQNTAITTKVGLLHNLRKYVPPTT